MAKVSAGLLLYKVVDTQLWCLLVRPGGPFFKNKDDGWWTIPKGEPNENEDPLATAKREFEEETGYAASAPFIELQPVTQKGGKKVFCWAFSGDLDPDKIVSNTYEIEWPPKSGKMKGFPEIDIAAWFKLDEAKIKINERQVAFLNELDKILFRSPNFKTL